MSHPVGGVSSRTVIVSWLLVVCACPTARAGDDGPGEDEKPRAEKKEGRPAPDAARRESAGKGGGASSLELRLEALEEWKEDMELKSLQQEAEAESVSEEEDMVPEERTYIQAVRSLQAQNPEISVAGDLLFKLDMDEDFERFYLAQDDRSGLPIRSLDLHMQSSLDPFSLFKSAMTFEPGGGVWIEELYLTWQAVLPGVSISLGRFRQQLGVVNRWHQHDLEQTDYPLPLLELLGSNGLFQDGVSLSWHMPSITAHVNELTVQVTNGENEKLFAGEFFSIPTVLAHFKNYYDLNEDTYLEIGLSGMWGVNNRRGFNVDVLPGRLFDEPWRHTWVGGADITLMWEPLNQAKYKSFTWHTEYLFVSKETGGGKAQGWGAFSYLQYKLSPYWTVGLRGDVVEPMERDRHGYEWMVAPYLTFLQSEFVYLRMEAHYGDGFEQGRIARLLLQIDFAAGPHKHEKY